MVYHFFHSVIQQIFNKGPLCDRHCSVHLGFSSEQKIKISLSESLHLKSGKTGDNYDGFEAFIPQEMLYL